MLCVMHFKCSSHPSSISKGHIYYNKSCEALVSSAVLQPSLIIRVYSISKLLCDHLLKPLSVLCTSWDSLFDILKITTLSKSFTRFGISWLWSSLLGLNPSTAGLPFRATRTDKKLFISTIFSRSSMSFENHWKLQFSMFTPKAYLYSFCYNLIT